MRKGKRQRPIDDNVPMRRMMVLLWDDEGLYGWNDNKIIVIIEAKVTTRQNNNGEKQQQPSGRWRRRDKELGHHRRCRVVCFFWFVGAHGKTKTFSASHV
jgi:hypothetical protein